MPKKLQMLLPFIVAFGCVHQAPLSKKERRKERKPPAKTLPKPPQTPITLGDHLGMRAIPRLSAREARTDLFLKVANLAARLDFSDLEKVADLARKTDHNALERATLVITALRTVLQVGIDAELITSHLHNQGLMRGNLDWALEKSIERATAQLGVSFVAELERNSFLHTYEAFQLVILVLERGNETINFGMQVHRVLVVLNERAESFQQRLAAFESWYRRGSSPLVGEPGDSAGGQGAGDGDGADNLHLTPALPYHFAAVENGEEAIKKAEDLIAQSRFLESISLLRTVREDSIVWSGARSMIKEASNKAVAELRRKAARAFQSAIPVTDTKARSVYLLEARKYLLSAIKNFPDSDQLSTVEQNLKVIDKNIELLAPKN